ncbi:hypothetical protein Tco_0287525 [Tanacetum coccineum]
MIYNFEWVSDDELEAPEEAPQPLEQEPPSPDYVPGPEHPPSPYYVLDPENLEYLVPADDEVPIEDQPLPADASPIALSPGYVADSNPLEEDLEEDPEEDPANYPADGGDDDDDDDDDNDEEEEEAFEEDEHLAPADSTILPTARISVGPQTPLSAATKALIATVAAALPSSPPPSPLTSLSSPLPHIPSPLLPLPSPPTHTSLAYSEAPLGYRAVYLAFESKAMTAVEEVNDRVTNLATTQRQETHELQAVDARWAWAYSKSRSQALEAQIRALQRDVDVLQRLRIRDEDKLTSHIQHEHDRFRKLVRTVEAGPQDGPTDAGSSC